MKVIYFFWALFTVSLSSSFAQVNVALMHQLVSESQSEHLKQDEAKNKQALVSAGEAVNRSGMTQLKTMCRTLQSRFQTLELAISAAQIGLQAAPIVAEITRQQSLIFRQAGNNPLLFALAYDAEADLADQAYLLSNYLYGLLVSIGDLNQMKASDRRILMAQVLTELRRIAGASKGLAMSMQYAASGKLVKALDPFAGYVNTDKQMAGRILRQAATLKVTIP
jgi:hypothetical protein